MKPALFSVLCEIKEKTGEFLLRSFSLCSPVCTGCNLVLRCSVPFCFSFPDTTELLFLMASRRTLLIVDLIKLHAFYMLWFILNMHYCFVFLLFWPSNHRNLTYFWPLSRLHTDQLKLILVDRCLWNSSQTPEVAAEQLLSSHTYLSDCNFPLCTEVP